VSLRGHDISDFRPVFVFCYFELDSIIRLLNLNNLAREERFLFSYFFFNPEIILLKNYFLL
jgi:hypothetical protein